jgi:putative tryptophan/tyrosine transport system substrate-binding protein
VPIVGLLSNASPDEQWRMAGLLVQALRDLGYLEGQNILFEYRGADGETERLPVLAAELVSVGVTVIVSSATPATRAAQEATSTIPIVGSAMADPICDGLVQNYASPEANITGKGRWHRRCAGFPGVWSLGSFLSDHQAKWTEFATATRGSGTLYEGR